MEAKGLLVGHEWVRGEGVWLVIEAEEVVPRLGSAYVKLRCRDQNGEIRETSVSSELEVEVRVDG